MTRHLVVLAFCVGLSTAAVAASSTAKVDGAVDAVMRHYDAAAVADGDIQVSAVEDIAYVTGVSPEGPWLDVWRRLDGEWKMVAEIGMNALAPIRFGAKRDRSCGTS